MKKHVFRYLRAGGVIAGPGVGFVRVSRSCSFVSSGTEVFK